MGYNLALLICKAIRDSMSKEDGYEAFERYCESIYSKQTTENGQKKVKISFHIVPITGMRLLPV